MLRFLRNLLVFEVLVGAVVVGLFAAMLLSRVAYYQEAAEKANMELAVNSIKSALRMRLATMLIQGHAGRYALLEQQNPMDWLEQKPPNYKGWLPENASIEELAGNWYFDHSSKTIVYWIERDQHFQGGKEGGRQVRYRVMLITEPALADRDGSPLVTGVRLVLKTPYKWL